MSIVTTASRHHPSGSKEERKSKSDSNSHRKKSVSACNNANNNVGKKGSSPEGKNTSKRSLQPQNPSTPSQPNLQQPVIKVEVMHSPPKSVKSKSNHHQKRHSASTPQDSSLLSEPTSHSQTRRKSSPALNPNETSPSSKKFHRRRKKSAEDPNETLLQVNKADLLSRRRLSSPPSLLQDQQFQFLQTFCPSPGGGGSNSSSRGSSGQGSLQQLAISGLNLSSTDMRNNTIRSGHQDIGTLFAPNNITYQDPISINLVNAPDNSTTQCDCGHINCPMCNLMMNLELTDPDLLK